MLSAMKAWGLRRLAALPFNLRYELFYQSARALGIRHYEVAGAAGQFVAPVYDQAVARIYLRDRRFSPDIVGVFGDYFVAHGGGVFVDVGANIGILTTAVARNPGVRVIAFEPDPDNFRLLRLNVVGNGIEDRAELVNAAVAAAPGEMRFARSDYNSGDHRLSATGEIAVKVVRLDDLTVETGALAVKIDTQGAEPLIVAGGARLLARAGLLVMEFWPWGMRRMGLEPQPVLDLVAGWQGDGHVMAPEHPVGPRLSVEGILAALREVVADGGEQRSVDLVLRRGPAAS